MQCAFILFLTLHTVALAAAETFDLGLLNMQLQELANVLKAKTPASLPQDNLLAELKEFAKNFPPEEKFVFMNTRSVDKTITMLYKVAQYFNVKLTTFFSLKQLQDMATQGLIKAADIKRYQQIDANSLLTLRTSNDAKVTEGKGKITHPTHLNEELLSTLQKRLPPDSADIPIIEMLTNNYKIHLMPLKGDIPVILYLFMQEIQRNEQLKQAITDFKFSIGQPAPSSTTNNPTIIIYSSGKANAQYIVDTLYALFKDRTGLNMTPRWNQKITSLIYWAQGDGNYKKKENDPAKKDYHALFEPGDDKGNGRVCYRADITGENVDYHLQDPSVNNT